MHSTPRTDKSTRNKTGNDAVPMTPMIDVVFQLLIYFIFTFQPIDVLAEIPVLSPRGVGGSSAERVAIYVNETEFRMNEVVVSPEKLDDLLANIADLAPNTQITLICQAHAQHEQVVRVLDLCHKHQLMEIAMLRAAER